MLGKVKALAAGFIVGLLVAPRSGRESRQFLIDWVSEFFDSGSRRLQELEEELAEKRETLP